MDKEIIISNRYHVKRKIGEGGMAKVYLAYDRHFEREVALKILKKENIDEKKIKSFKREAHTLGLLNDPNIVSIYDVGEENGIHYIANEYVDGMTLKEYISTCSPIPVDEVINITSQILSGLKHAHNKGVVHKDIKSQNILIDSKRNVKITDLGIADIIDEEITRTQSLMGTPQYVAPEILNRDELTIQSDIYSVGILLYELMVGKAPFTGEKPAIIMIKQMNHPLPSITEQRSDVPQALENIAIKASAKKLENRYKCVEDMQADLFKIELGYIHVPKIILENDLIDDKKLEQTIILDTTKIIDGSKLEEKPKKKSKMRIFLLTIILLLTALLVINRLKPEPDTMPDFRNKDIEVVQEDEIFDHHEFSIIYNYSNDIEENAVISTDPKQGSELEEGQEIFLTVSRGPQSKEMNDYTGTKASVAENELTSLGYKVQIEEVDSLDAEGTIISQSPAAGESINYGATVYFKVSKGSIETKVPNFIGLQATEAEKWASENGITIKESQVCDEVNIEDGSVSYQTPSYNDDIKSGDTLEIQIADTSCKSEDTTTDQTSDTTNTDSTNTDSTNTDSTNTDSTNTDSTNTDSTNTDSTNTDSTNTDSSNDSATTGDNIE